MCECTSEFAGTTREDSIVKQSTRHCEPTGRANARRMTGSAKQSIEPQRKMDCFVATLLAMTVSPFVPARRPCESTRACTHLENRLKYRDLDDPRFWKRLHVGP